MRVTTVGCDRCGRPVDGDPTVIEFLGALKSAVGRADSCSDCAAEFLEWLRRGPAPEEPEKNEGAIER
jgi:hypothetical protein